MDLMVFEEAPCQAALLKVVSFEWEDIVVVNRRCEDGEILLEEGSPSNGPGLLRSYS